MRKIDKFISSPASLLGAPVPSCADEVSEHFYKADDVRRQLVLDQHYKCAFCECYLPLQYHDVEHFRPKSHYYWLGHEWRNLLYSCERCNRSYKKAKFPLSDCSVQAVSPSDDLSLEHPLLINPAEIDPAAHIVFDKYVAKGITPEGRATIELLHLNDQNECPELIDNRKQHYELYRIENDKIRVAQIAIRNNNLPAEAIACINDLIRLCKDSIKNLTDENTPFSGMLISQV